VPAPHRVDVRVVSEVKSWIRFQFPFQWKDAQVLASPVASFAVDNPSALRESFPRAYADHHRDSMPVFVVCISKCYIDIIT
jgi:hypothetical protein